jgi:hypothetical protein
LTLFCWLFDAPQLLLLFVPASPGHPDAYSAQQRPLRPAPSSFAAPSLGLQDNILCVCRCDHCLHCEWKEQVLDDESGPLPSEPALQPPKTAEG